MVFGTITDGFEAEMRRAIARNPNLKRVEIESLGGLTLEARRTAQLLNKHHISIRVAGTITSPADMSAMRITPSSMTLDSVPMTLLSSASASAAISSSVESGPGWMNSASFCRNERLSSFSGKGRSG